jgi:hypothetical protein
MLDQRNNVLIFFGPSFAQINGWQIPKSFEIFGNIYFFSLPYINK